VSSTSTAIEWTDATWNPVTGCSKVSEGCRNCYAATLAPRLAAMGQEAYTDLPWTKRNAPENVKLHPDRLDGPLRWSKPRRIFVNSMSDLFHELVPFEFVDRVFAVMTLAEKHTFQILTKRPERMAEYMTGERRAAVTAAIAAMDLARFPTRAIRDRYEYVKALHEIGPPDRGDLRGWPLPNVWLGTSVEDERVRGRVDHLRRVPAAVRFLSCEPLIGPLKLDLDGIHWVIVGGESGRNHRPINAQWVRDIRTQAKEAGVAFFFKQWGGTTPKVGGRKLDGCTYDEMPAPRDQYLTQLSDSVVPAAL
jgi:protein gp37